MKDQSAGEEADEIGDRTCEALSREHMLSKRAAISQCGYVAHTNPPMTVSITVTMSKVVKREGLEAVTRLAIGKANQAVIPKAI